MAEKPEPKYRQGDLVLSQLVPPHYLGIGTIIRNPYIFSDRFAAWLYDVRAERLGIIFHSVPENRLTKVDLAEQWPADQNPDFQLGNKVQDITDADVTGAITKIGWNPGKEFWYKVGGFWCPEQNLALIAPLSTPSKIAEPSDTISTGERA